MTFSYLYCMYIKTVVKKNKSSKTKYTYLHLVENIRTPNGPRQRLICNLGNLDIDKEHYKELANCIEAMLTGQAELFSQNPTVSDYAGKAVSKIRKKKSRFQPSQKHDGQVSQKDIRSIDISSLDASQVRTIGPEYLCHKMWQSLDIDHCLTDCGISPNVLPLLQALVIGRAVSPGSERHTKEWADTQSAIYELIGEPLRNSLNSYYRGGDVLYQYKEVLEKHLCAQERDLFCLQEKICFFDLTNTHFEGEMKKNGKARFGRSKQKRNDCRLLTLALIIDEDGFIKHSKLYPGNQYEAHTLQTMLEELEKINPFQAKNGKPTVVMDAGIADKKNVAYLKQKEFHYIVVNKGKTPFTDSDIEDLTPLRVDKNGDATVSVKRFDDDDSDEVYILCKSQKRKMKEDGISSRQEALFVEQLKNTRNGLQKKGHTKKYAKIVEKIGRLREKYPKASKKYDVEVLTDRDAVKEVAKLQATNIVWQEKQFSPQDAQTINGCYVLRSDRIDLNDDEIWSVYVMLTSIEQAFKDMKSHLGLRPNFHQTQERGDAHMFISVLAYHLIHLIEYQLKKKGDTRSWHSIREILSTHSRLTVECSETDAEKVKGKIFLRLCSRSETSHSDIYEKLNLSTIPLRNKHYENL